MRNVSWFVRLSFAVALVAVIVVAGLGGGTSSDALAATGKPTTAATAGVPGGLCLAPTPTPTPKPSNTPKPTNTPKGATPAATMAASLAPTMAASLAPTMAPTTAPTMAATVARTAAPTMAATSVPPTAIPVGGKPAYAGVTVRARSKLLRFGKPCVDVFGMLDGGPADAAGIQAKDLILAFDKTIIKTPADFYNELLKHQSGDTVTITVQRGSLPVVLQMTLGLNPNLQ